LLIHDTGLGLGDAGQPNHFIILILCDESPLMPDDVQLCIHLQHNWPDMWLWQLEHVRKTSILDLYTVNHTFEFNFLFFATTLAFK